MANENYSFCVSASSTHKKAFIMVGNPGVVVPNKATWIPFLKLEIAGWQICSDRAYAIACVHS